MFMYCCGKSVKQPYLESCAERWYYCWWQSCALWWRFSPPNLPPSTTHVCTLLPYHSIIWFHPPVANSTRQIWIQTVVWCYLPPYSEPSLFHGVEMHSLCWDFLLLVRAQGIYGESWQCIMVVLVFGVTDQRNNQTNYYQIMNRPDFRQHIEGNNNSMELICFFLLCLFIFLVAFVPLGSAPANKSSLLASSLLLASFLLSYFCSCFIAMT